MLLRDLPTPALLVDADALEHNLTFMAQALPGTRCRPHVKAHKCTALAHRQAACGHRSFTCATTQEVVGMVRAGLGDDLLLANEVVDRRRLAELAALADRARITVAVDSDDTVEAAADAGIAEVLIDVNVGLPRCGCDPDDAARLARLAQQRGMHVRGVMGYEGHIVGKPDRAERTTGVDEAMAKLRHAHALVGGAVVSAGGTGTFDINTTATEIQAGSYALMDTAYQQLDLPFRPALSVWSTVISVSASWAVCDAGLKSLSLDHGNPSIDDAQVWFCSDEHTTFAPAESGAVEVGDRVRVWPAHVDPTVALHPRLHLVREGEVLESWSVDLRGW